MWISPETKNDKSQMDELFWFIKRKERTKTKENTYIILLISTSPRQILGYYAGKYRNAKEIAEDSRRSAESESILHGRELYIQERDISRRA